MTRIKKFSLLFFIFISIGITACCSCGGEKDNIVKGFITIIGNEPFSKLGIKLENNKNYLLECSDELKKELWNRQGFYYAVEFSESKIENGVPVLVVKKAIPLN